MRTLLVALMLVAGCGGKAPDAQAPDQPPGAPGARMDLRCTPQADFDEAACAASGDGCGYGPPLICRGIAVGEEQRESERAAEESGRLPCTCICERARMECSMVP